MKFSQVLIALAVSISGTAFAADDHGHEAKPMHGGVTAQAKDVDYELVAKADKLQLFMRDHGKPFDVSGMTAKATLLAGSDKQEVQLQPVDGKLEAAGNFKVASGTKAVVAVSKVGKAVASVRFTLK
ncbi:MAG: hypothetical protein ACD_23C00745G0003 [uncultured bacterium]|jgi:signal transduction histidine kinase|uniref:hypothetical protein n=1 Tax=Pseudomonadota TaxID=1224 RepID=UPI000284BF8B|nr:MULTISPECIES: hypothetical protein [unclassified Acidovorax]EKD97785.1 MAG: hypothetical protein ACD_23C00745G0003 [uncultured bacterium]OZA57358.1 MAG: hypothetical protein B7X79_07045 [Acidovorax sp. 17-64-282]HQT51639.1 hypothetical protein [Acidovorax defluvii]OYY25892.1 MAG: hypothetical protein B7Y64_17965 [Acidovorax sp. 35-64-16]OYY86831.1 MAG: hypothetical protein B7Y46_03965 [Acidovorax sp. 28-64-14]